MKMTMRWFGTGYDPVTLDKIRQVPGIYGVITTLYGVPAGEEWKKDEIAALKKQVEDAGLFIAGIESLNIHDAIKTGSSERDMYIEKYNASLKALSQNGINLVCYNFMPVCDEYGINMAIHPDDPAWSVLGLPRIVTNKERLLRIIKTVDNPHNGITLCTGSLGSNLDNDIPDIIRSLKGRIHFAHVRNVKHNAPEDFEEAAHLSSDGSLDMYKIMKAFYEIGFTGPLRPDHGRNIWGEVSMPGYGLYARALGLSYLNGLLEAIIKN